MHICADLVGTDATSCLGISKIIKLQLSFYKVCLAQEGHKLIWFMVVSCPVLFPMKNPVENHFTYAVVS